MTDQEILYKYRLRKVMFDREKKKEVMEMLYKYKEAFSLWDEIETCPNIEVEIDITEKSLFLLYHTMLRRKIRL